MRGEEGVGEGQSQRVRGWVGMTVARRGCGVLCFGVGGGGRVSFDSQGQVLRRVKVGGVRRCTITSS